MNEQHDKIMEEYKAQLQASFTRGVSVGTKIGAEYIQIELGQPEEWVEMSKEQLMKRLVTGLTKAEEIKNSGIKLSQTDFGGDMDEKGY